ELSFEIGLARSLHRQQLAKLRDLTVETRQRAILIGDFLLQIKLHDDENGQEKDDAEDQRRQRVDEARPVVHRAFAAPRPSKGHHTLTQEFTFSSNMISSSFLISRCCSAWPSTHSRIVLCSVRMCCTST